MFRAEGEILAIEERIYARLVGEVLGHSSEIQLTANFISALDVLLSLAAVASERGYTRPTLDMSKDFIVKNARHPVIEVTLGKNPFTPNDFNFSAENGRRIALITGPNMAGKSTYLRTAALIAIMAHMGSFVPASSSTKWAAAHRLTTASASHGPSSNFCRDRNTRSRACSSRRTTTS